MSSFLINPYVFVAAAPLVFLLDDYPGAAGAYSLRQLRTGVTNVVRVRRSSDNAELDFTAFQVANGTLAGWVGAGNNGFVRTWYDQSGNNRDATQTSTSNQPQIVSNGALVTRNGKPTLLMNSSELAISSSLVTSQVFSLLTVTSSSNTSSGAREIISSWNGPNNAIYLGTNGSTIRFTDRVSNAGSYGATNTLKTIGCYSRSSGSAVFLNSSQIFSGSAFSNLVTTSNWFIGVQGTFTGKEYWEGDISEIIVYPSDQFSVRVEIESNVSSYYAIY